jgi:hypothetical protein
MYGKTKKMHDDVAISRKSLEDDAGIDTKTEELYWTRGET